MRTLSMGCGCYVPASVREPGGQRNQPGKAVLILNQHTYSSTPAGLSGRRRRAGAKVLSTAALRPLPACPAGEAAAGLGSGDLLHLPDKPAGVAEKRSFLL